MRKNYYDTQFDNGKFAGQSDAIRHALAQYRTYGTMGTITKHDVLSPYDNGYAFGWNRVQNRLNHYLGRKSNLHYYSDKFARKIITY